jgi:NAD(P)-dependent dehydrogenase (short-subunit alcohol dehydrogenase family)
MQGLDGRVAVVTGGGGGIGSAICEVLAERGATIVSVDNVGERAEATAARCREVAPASEGIELDVTGSAAVDAAFVGVAERHGRIDILVTAAGISAAADPESARDDSGSERGVGVGIGAMSDASWSRMLAVHLDGTFFCARAAVPVMQQHGWGSIVCISSIAGLAGIGPLHYSAAKGGILGFVRSLARMVAPDNIRVNAVCPGAIDAGMTRNYPQSTIDAHLTQVPLGRLGTAREIGAAVAYFASDDGGYTTGAWLSPNGGVVIA